MQQYWSSICKANVCLIASLEQNCIIELNHTPRGKLWHSSYCMNMHDVATGSTYSTEIFEAGIDKINICKGLCADKKALHSSFIVLICQGYPIPQEKDIISPIFEATWISRAKYNPWNVKIQLDNQAAETSTIIIINPTVVLIRSMVSHIKAV